MFLCVIYFDNFNLDYIFGYTLQNDYASINDD